MLENATLNSFIRVFLYRMALTVFIWWILTEGEAGSFLAGLPFAGATAVFWCFFTAHVPLKIIPLAHFFFFFVWQSLQAGVDVAFRVMRPKLRIDPDMISYSFRLPEGPSRVLMADVLNLLPGTLSVRMAGDVLEMHVLDRNGPVLEKARLIEERISAIFAQAIE